MSKLYNADTHMQFTRNEIKHTYTEKVNFCMYTDLYAIYAIMHHFKDILQFFS